MPKRAATIAPAVRPSVMMLTRRSSPRSELRLASRMSSTMSSVWRTLACGRAYPSSEPRRSAESMACAREREGAKATYGERLDLADDLLALLGEGFEEELDLFVVVGGARLALQLGRQVHSRQVIICVVEARPSQPLLREGEPARARTVGEQLVETLLHKHRALLKDGEFATVMQQEAEVVAVDVLFHVRQELDDVAAHVVEVGLEGRHDVDERCGGRSRQPSAAFSA